MYIYQIILEYLKVFAWPFTILSIAFFFRNEIRNFLKRIDNGEKFFWSIIPYWKIDSTNSRRILHSGDLESD